MLGFVGAIRGQLEVESSKSGYALARSAPVRHIVGDSTLLCVEEP